MNQRLRSRSALCSQSGAAVPRNLAEKPFIIAQYAAPTIAMDTIDTTKSRNSLTGAMRRRTFLGRTLAAGAAWGFPSIGVAGTNDEIRIAIVGLNSKGRQHIELFGKVPGVRIVALCDVDKKVLARTAEKFFKGKIGQHVDYREVLDRKDVDAVCLATPNHWHALGAVWACDAGKDVYVEKPVSQNIWEGRQIIAAAERSGRIVATGTQSRSAPGTREFVADVRAGTY
jgi:hypothetical protein